VGKIELQGHHWSTLMEKLVVLPRGWRGGRRGGRRGGQGRSRTGRGRLLVNRASPEKIGSIRQGRGARGRGRARLSNSTHFDSAPSLNAPLSQAQPAISPAYPSRTAASSTLQPIHQNTHNRNYRSVDKTREAFPVHSAKRASSDCTDDIDDTNDCESIASTHAVFESSNMIPESSNVPNTSGECQTVASTHYAGGCPTVASTVCEKMSGKTIEVCYYGYIRKIHVPNLQPYEKKCRMWYEYQQLGERKRRKHEENHGNDFISKLNELMSKDMSRFGALDYIHRRVGGERKTHHVLYLSSIELKEQPGESLGIGISTKMKLAKHVVAEKVFMWMSNKRRPKPLSGIRLLKHETGNRL